MSVKMPGKIPGVRIGSSGGDRGEVNFYGFSREEISSVDGVANGYNWMTIQDGVPKFVSVYESLPEPAVDDEMLPFWRKLSEEHESTQLELFDLGTEKLQNSSPSFIVQHLCGYRYTSDNYRYNAELLESYGFECLRSRRRANGRFWEVWLLPGTWAAKGELQEVLSLVTDPGSDYQKAEKKKVEKTIDFLCRKVDFGTLDVCVQRAAMTVDD